MLKLEKILRTREVNIIVKDPERRLTGPLMKAFAIALTLHLILASLFQITTLSFRGSTTVLTPTLVIAESPVRDGATLAVMDSNQPLDKRIPIRMASEPQLLSKLHIMDESLLFPPSLSMRKGVVAPIRLFVSGDIHNMLINKDLKQSLPKLPPKANEVESARSVFSVAVNPIDGRIFWYETLENTSITALDAYAELVLKELEFTQNPNHTIAKGIVEIHFNLSREKS